MSPIGLIKTFILALEDSPYEQWADFVLFVGLAFAVLSAIMRILFRRESLAAAKMTLALVKKAHGGLERSIQLAPGAEEIRKRIYPYVDLATSSFLMFIGLLYGGMVGLLTAWLHQQLNWYQLLLGISFYMVAMIYARANFAAASWAWHKIRTGEERPIGSKRSGR